MKTMRERIMRAVFFSTTCVHHDHEAVWKEKYRLHPTMWEEVADAVLSELETPTDGMLNGARDWSHKEYGQPIGNDAAIGCWQAMLASAAREGKSDGR